ncbi:60S ribosomal protein L31 [Candidatus Pacearchaeota archaeon]|nr:60S ribosomal protein L31 [Candidatus Pacearchaeota archaeon]
MAKKENTKPTEKIEREYVIPLRKYWKRVPRYKRANRAVKGIKEFLAQHMQIRDRDLNKIKVDIFLNEQVWTRGIKKPPVKVKIKAIKENGIVRVELLDLPDKIKFKKKRFEKIEARAQESLEKKKSFMEKAKEGMQQPAKTTSTEEAKSKETEKKEDEKVEEKKEDEKEKKSAVIEAGNKMEKVAAKQAKHQTTPKMKQPKRPQRKSLAK